ncbi:MAG: DUF5719 family protein, partial [Bifidobacteriaceae bacterium]|nr:DUF5719 family protein [Bifidobacteriaceae bacterium]
PARISGQGRDIAVDNEPVEDAPIRLTAFAASFAAEAKDSPSPVSGEDSDDQPVAAGGTFQHLADGDLRGVAASACVPGGSEAWIVAGSTEPGSSARLLLTNPGFTTIWADLELWDGAGKREAMGLTGLTILPGTQKAVLLEGIVADAGRLAVHATASGGDLAVFLQHSRLEGLTPGGIELATPGALPATEVVVPGLNVTSSTFDSVRTSALRILSTGTEDANVSVELWGPDGPTSLPGLEEAVLHPEVVTDLSLGGLPGGHYTAVITSDQPVVAAALSLRAGEVDQPEEFAWTASALPSEQGYVALPTADLSYQLVAAAATDAQLEVRTVSLEGDLGEPETVELSGQTTESFDPAALGADQETVALQFRWLGGPGWLGLLVSASDEAGEMISALVPPALGAGWAEVRVYPR